MHSHSKSRNITRYILYTVLTAASLLFLGCSILNTRKFLSVSDPSWEVKIPLMISITGAFLSGYVIFLMSYSKWSAKEKKRLKELYEQDHRILFEKYNRIFIDWDLIRAIGQKPNGINRLSQRDKREVFNIMNKD